MLYEIRTGGREAPLTEILLAREARVARRAELLRAHGATLAVLTVNMPGPVKLSPVSCAVFAEGCGALRRALGVPHEVRWLTAGAEAYFLSPLAPDEVKRIAVTIENSHPLGRLMDIDVYSPDGASLSREALGHPPRRCLLCGENAHACGRSRTHSAAQLVAKADELVQQYERARCASLPERLGRLAADALYEEVWATPKPGLVDRASNGAHDDMDYASFLASATVLRQWFIRCAEEGTRHASPRAALDALRPIGLAAEHEMFEATGGVNTHKGALFSLGLLCAAAARVSARGDSLSPEPVAHEAAAMADGLCAREYGALNARAPQTRGEQMYLAHGVRGVRGEAEAGFPAALDLALPALRGVTDRNEALVMALVRLMAALTDTNVLGRGGLSAAQSVRARAAACRTLADVSALDEALTRERLSPGGCADLLAVSVFFDNIIFEF